MIQIRYIAHFALCVIYVYVFCFASTLNGSSWANWLWALVTGFIMLAGFGLLADDETNEHDKVCILSCMDSLCMASIVMKIIAQIPEIHSLVLILCLFYVVEIGISRISFSHIFVWMGVLMVWPVINFHVWYEIIGFAIFCMLNILSVMYSTAMTISEDDEDGDDEAARWGFFLIIIILISCLWFINHRSPILERISVIGYLYFIYCILGVILAVANNVAATIISIAAGAYFFTFLSDWGTSAEWGMQGIALVWYWLSLFLNTLFEWVVWGAEKIGLVWLITHAWEGVLFLGKKLLWLLCWKWFSVSLCVCVFILLFVRIAELEKKNEDLSNMIKKNHDDLSAKIYDINEKLKWQKRKRIIKRILTFGFG